MTRVHRTGDTTNEERLQQLRREHEDGVRERRMQEFVDRGSYERALAKADTEQLHEVLLSLARGQQTLARIDSLTGYLIASARRAARKGRRVAAEVGLSELDPLSPTAGPPTRLLRREDAIELHEAVDRLSPKQREAILQYLAEDGVASATERSNRRHAIARLKDMLADTEPDVSGNSD